MKNNLLRYYREGIKPTVELAMRRKKNSDRSALVNSNMKKLLKDKLDEYEKFDLNQVLMTHYTYYVAMLEARNQVWNYDYMAFSRRIGELWEPFCKLAFEFSLKDIEFYEPKSYEEFKENLSSELTEFVNGLSISEKEREQLNYYITRLWSLNESGAINLKEDLHFISDGIYHVVDFKSGFSSNEKGNVNRLLQVAKIYSTANYKCLIFVRQPEEENNHYLQTLINSNLWDVYCSNEAYEKIFELTGVDLKGWMSQNMLWKDDISDEFLKYLTENNLLQYLTW